MKRIVLMIVPALICGVVFTGCEKAEKSTKENDLVLTSEDIKSFNVTSGEIVFTAKKVDEIISHAGFSSELNFLIDGKPVFVPSIPISQFNGSPFCCSPCPWDGMNDLGLVILNSSAFLLIEGYFPWHFEGGLTLKEQEENSQKRKKELEVLIVYLKKAGKIVE